MGPEGPRARGRKRFKRRFRPLPPLRRLRRTAFGRRLARGAPRRRYEPSSRPTRRALDRAASHDAGSLAHTSAVTPSASFAPSFVCSRPATRPTSRRQRAAARGYSSKAGREPARGPARRLGSPMPRRKRRTCWRSVTRATSRMRPPQPAQRRTSIEKQRLSSSAHGRYREPPDASSARETRRRRRWPGRRAAWARFAGGACSRAPGPLRNERCADEAAAPRPRAGRAETAGPCRPRRSRRRRASSARCGRVRRGLA